ncbi:MAG: D-tyrosyl-tRNA(Tyr) deacylase [Planctomycetes bacterium]|nr:D-tyrosyl-tRNA(Tyr) deacylase [Planctomycetota bacterium]
MKALIQRVSQARVEVEGTKVGEITRGLLVLLCAVEGDGDSEFEALLGKLLGLRVFNDDQGKMNLSCEDVGGDYLVVSQFTLAADTRKGKRPSYVSAMQPELAEEMYQRFCNELAMRSGRKVEQGVFGANMQVSLINDGPVTLMIDYPPTQADA